MKYIRTKDGRIYEIIDETENSFELCGSFEKKMSCNCIMIKRMFSNNEKPTYRLTDTIEELCDEFVVKINIHNIVIHDLKSALKLAEGHEGFKIYGAIWTDTGLIYVAKMNNKGVMELL